MTYTLNNTDDVIDLRDVITRFEELESERENLQDHLDACRDAYAYHDSDDTKSAPEWAELQDAEKALADWAGENTDELAQLQNLLDELKGYGGDEQWRGDWYPGTLIRDSYFPDYAKELLEDCGEVPANLPSYIEIDWDATARNIQVDYSTVEIDGAQYWYR